MTFQKQTQIPNSEAVLRQARAIDTGRPDSHTPSSLATLGDSVVSVLRDYPGPALAIGAGLAWLLVSREQKKAVSLPNRIRERAVRGTEQLHDAALGAKEQILGAKDQLIDSASEAREHLMDVVADTKEHSGEMLRDAKTSLNDGLDTAREKAGQTYQSAVGSLHDGADHARDAYQSLLEQNPLVLGVCAVAMGIAAGMLMPSTRQEDELMGPTRDSLLDQAKAIVNDAREAAISSLKSGSDSVKASLGQAAEEAKETIQESFASAKDSLQDDLAGDNKTVDQQPYSRPVPMSKAIAEQPRMDII